MGMTIAEAFIQLEMEDKQVLGGLADVDAAFIKTAEIASASAAQVSASANTIANSVEMAAASTAAAETALVEFGVAGEAAAVGAGVATGGVGAALLAIGAAISFVAPLVGEFFSDGSDGAKEMEKNVKSLAEQLAKMNELRTKAAADAAREDVRAEHRAQDPKAREKFDLEQIARLRQERAKLSEEASNPLANWWMRGIFANDAKEKNPEISDDTAFKVADEKMKERRDNIALTLRNLGRDIAKFEADIVSAKAQADRANDEKLRQKHVKDGIDFNKMMLGEKEKDVRRQMQLDEENRRTAARVAAEKQKQDDKAAAAQAKLDAQRDRAKEAGLALLDRAGGRLDRPGQAQAFGAADIARNIQLAILNSSADQKREALDKARNQFLGNIDGNMAQAVKDLKENLGMIGRLH